MAFKLIGTEYGGWMINTDIVPDKSTIISAGVGEDISFDLFLMNEKKCKVVGIDPTPKSHSFIESQHGLQNFQLIKKALHSNNDDLIKLYKNKNPNHVSESILPNHESVLGFDSYFSETINLQKVFEDFENISIVKMDIEGSEYEVVESLGSIPDSVRQFCIEFHHFCTNKTVEDTKKMIQIMNSLGFENYVEKPSNKPLNEITFWR
jgi:FkbM family methyltransferase|tara:strand:+ start:4721 stop:5341 length:621 start_codon:yes stop_codon:yes gene_type:complete